MTPYQDSVAPLADGNEGVYQTLDRMGTLIRQAPHPPPLSREPITEALVSEIFYWVRGHLHYVEHPPGEQTIITPAALLHMISTSPDHRAVGDCVSYTVLLGYLLRSMGATVRLVVRSKRPDAIFDHVYLRVQLDDGSWLAADCSGEMALGWEDRDVTITAQEDRPV